MNEKMRSRLATDCAWSMAFYVIWPRGTAILLRKSDIRDPPPIRAPFFIERAQKGGTARFSFLVADSQMSRARTSTWQCTHHLPSSQSCMFFFVDGRNRFKMDLQHRKSRLRCGVPTVPTLVHLLTCSVRIKPARGQPSRRVVDAFFFRRTDMEPQKYASGLARLWPQLVHGPYCHHSRSIIGALENKCAPPFRIESEPH